MDLHEFAPRRYAIVAAKSVAAALAFRSIQTRPAAHGGIDAIGAHDPLRAHFAAIHQNRAVADARDASAPEQAHPGIHRAGGHHPVKGGAAQTKAAAAWE